MCLVSVSLIGTHFSIVIDICFAGLITAGLPCRVNGILLDFILNSGVLYSLNYYSTHGFPFKRHGWKMETRLDLGKPEDLDTGSYLLNLSVVTRMGSLKVTQSVLPKDTILPNNWAVEVRQADAPCKISTRMQLLLTYLVGKTLGRLIAEKKKHFRHLFHLKPPFSRAVSLNTPFSRAISLSL